MKKPTYTVQMRPAESGQGYTATIAELGETITGSTQAEVWARGTPKGLCCPGSGA